MRSLLWLFLFLLIAPAAYGLDAFSCTGRSLQTAQAAESGLKRLQERYQSVEGITARFRQESFLDALQISEASTGSVWFTKPGKMRWDYEEPEKQIFILNDRTLWFYQEEQKQALVDTVERVLISDLPVAFLLGVGNLMQDFSVRTSCVTDDGVVYDLAPRGGEKNASLKGFQLLVDPVGNLPVGARVTDVGGNVTSVLLREINVTSAISPELYRAQFPTGTDIDDRREETRRSSKE